MSASITDCKGRRLSKDRQGEYVVYAVPWNLKTRIAIGVDFVKQNSCARKYYISDTICSEFLKRIEEDTLGKEVDTKNDYRLVVYENESKIVIGIGKNRRVVYLNGRCIDLGTNINVDIFIESLPDEIKNYLSIPLLP
jgi:hypothetical protein